ncbi:MAG: hypothetical protein Q4D81_09200 [Eubacteriales bacterium]|nr:hypothetical protein [Eubacteriales bacterium]
MKAGKRNSRLKKQKLNRSEAGAYFTVEASMIMPVVLCLSVMILYMSFYVYDRCVLSQDCYVLSYRQSIEKAGRDRAGRSAAEEQMGNKLFMLSGFESDASEGGTIRVRGKAAVEAPLFGLPVFEQNRIWILGVEKTARRTDPPAVYRKVRRILAVASGAAAQNGREE